MKDYAKYSGAHQRKNKPWLKFLVLAAVIYVALLFLEHYAKGANLFNEEISTAVRLPNQTAQIISNPTPELSQLAWIKKKIKHGDNLISICQKQNIPLNEIHAIMGLGESVKVLDHLYPNHLLAFNVDQSHHLQRMNYDIDDLNTLTVRYEDGQYIAKLIHKNLEKRFNFSHVVIQDSLFQAGQKAGLDDDVIMKLANIFGWDIDFALDVRPGDSFSVLHEERFIDGQKVGNGPILIAEFTHNNDVYRAIRFTDENGESGYYTPEGLSLRKAFLRSPVKFTRISSRFSLGRNHPILHHIRAHKGVDYAAPTGTPVKASGDGKVIFFGKKGGYGNAVILKHGLRYTTLYGHLSRFHKGLKRGMSVKQGQVIAYVGSTGLATGPHLHYEFRVAGIHRNPLTIKLPKAKPLLKEYKDRFLAQTQSLMNKLSKQQQVYLALQQDNTVS